MNDDENTPLARDEVSPVHVESLLRARCDVRGGIFVLTLASNTSGAEPETTTWSLGAYLIDKEAPNLGAAMDYVGVQHDWPEGHMLTPGDYQLLLYALYTSLWGDVRCKVAALTRGLAAARR